MKRNQLEKVATILEATTILLTAVYTVIRMFSILTEEERSLQREG